VEARHNCSSAVAKFQVAASRDSICVVRAFMLLYAMRWPARCNVLRMGDVCAGVIRCSTSAEIRRGP
jgi:hypothetical protein